MTGDASILAAPVALVLVALGVWWLATVDRLAAAGVAGAGWRAMIMVPLAPIRSALRLLLNESRPTETPDLLLWRAAPVLLVTLTLAALAVMPMAPGMIGADLSVGVVFFTAMFALVMVAIFAAGWGPNSKYPLIAGYRFIGLMLAYEMPFAITIIAVALPAESLALGDIVQLQKDVVWNVVLQPVGFLIYLLSALAVAFWGPFEMISSADLAGGAELEMGGADLALWRFGHYALLLTASAFAVPLFLGGDAGPFLPGPAWTCIKVLIVASVLVATTHAVPRLRLEAFMKIAWIALIPLSLANLFLVGLLLLLSPALHGGA
jgi:NADH-quinone oxidoreductase subunit H